MREKVGIVIPARNEASSLPMTLAQLRDRLVVVIDDGSNDGTANIARRHGASAIMSLPDRGYSGLNKPELAQVINEGLKALELHDPEHVCILGADHVLPADYLDKVLGRMAADPEVAVASGRIEGERWTWDFPFGSGRIIDAHFLRQVGFRFPESFGWEDWLVYKAKAMHRKTLVYPDIISHTSRPMKYAKKGEIMYALNYHWLYALGRCLTIMTHSPKDGLGMLKGFLFHKGVGKIPDKEVCHYVHAEQKRKIKRMLLPWSKYL